MHSTLHDIPSDLVKSILDVTRFRADPNSEIIERFFEGIDIDNYPQVLVQKDEVLKEILDQSLSNEANKELPQPLNGKYFFGEKSSFYKGVVTINEDIFVEEVNIPEHGIQIFAPTFIRKGTRLKSVKIYNRTLLGLETKLNNVVIDAPTIIQANAHLEYSKIQDSDRHNFIGKNAKISNVDEFRGSFVSGGPLRPEGRARTYIHSNSLNNAIMGAYSGISDGTDFYNHPISGEDNILIHPKTRDKINFGKDPDYRKLPILVGLYAVIGPQCLVNSGSILGAGVVTGRQENIDGLIKFVNEVQRSYPVRK